MDDWSGWRDQDANSITELRLTVLVIQQLCVHWNNLCLNKPFEACIELKITMEIVHALRDVIRNLETERNLSLSMGDHIALKVCESDHLLVGSQLFLMFNGRPFITAIYLLCRVNQLQSHDQRVSWESLLKVDLDTAHYWVVAIKCSAVSFKVNLEG